MPGARFCPMPIVKRAAIHIFSDQERPAVEIARVINGKNVWVIERGRHLCLTLKAFSCNGVGNVAEKEFDRNGTIQFCIDRTIDFTYPAGPNASGNAIAQPERTGHQCKRTSCRCLRVRRWSTRQFDQSRLIEKSASCLLVREQKPNHAFERLVAVARV